MTKKYQKLLDKATYDMDWQDYNDTPEERDIEIENQKQKT